MAEVTILIAFLAGLVSFVSPCILPLIPAFLSYLSGIAITETERQPARARLTIFLNAIAFVLGFVLVFSLLGVLLNSVLASAAYDTRVLLGQAGGIVIILFGLSLLGVLKVPWLEREHKLKPKTFRVSYLTSFIFGVAFAAGWTPCVGPVLGSILTLAIVTPGAALNLLLAYSLGLGIPFLIVGLFTSQASGWINRSLRFMKPFRIVMGLLLIAIGVLVFFNLLNLLASFVLIGLPLSQ